MNAGDATRPLPLAGLRIADFSWILAGPQGTHIFADLGAEVIRIESESHLDSMRLGQASDAAEPSINGSGYFNNINRNKLGLTANLYHPAGREVVERLIARSDFVVENFSAGVLERLGFGWERLQQLNPRLIYVSLSGFGHLGRDAAYVTWGPTAAAVAGVTAMSGLPELEPAGWGFSYLDHAAGYFAAVAMLMALYHRDQTGDGQYVDISQVETGLVVCGVPILDYQVNGRTYERKGNHSAYPAIAPHGTYPCAGDDRWIAIVAETDGQWRALCEVLGTADLATDPRFTTNLGRLAAQAALDEAIAAGTRRFESRELMYLLQARGVPAGTVQNSREKVEQDPQLAARGFYVKAPHPVLGERRFEGLPLHFSRARWAVRRGAPVLGEHTAHVLAEVLGYDDEAIAGLIAEAAV